jgi:hypothetical protein
MDGIWLASGARQGGRRPNGRGGCRLADDDQRIWAQKRSNPNIISSATVTAAEINTDPKQPRRFEKKKNMICQHPTL